MCENKIFSFDQIFIDRKSTIKKKKEEKLHLKMLTLINLIAYRPELI